MITFVPEEIATARFKCDTCKVVAPVPLRKKIHSGDERIKAPSFRRVGSTKTPDSAQ
jgi:hypothetical protein